MKKVLSLLAAFLLVTNVSIKAEEFAIIVDDVQIIPGQSSEIVVKFVKSSEWTSNDGLVGFSMDMYLPEGVNWTGETESDIELSIEDLSDASGIFYQISWGQSISMHGYTLAEEGVLFRLPVYINNDVTTSLEGSFKNVTATIAYDNGSYFENHNTKAENIELEDMPINFYLMVPQTLDLTTIPDMAYGDESYALPKTTAEGLPLVWTVGDATMASVSDYQLSALKAGTVTVTASQAGQAQYLPFTREFTLTIGKAALTITPNDCSRKYGEENPAFTFSYAGFVNADDASVLTTQPSPVRRPPSAVVLVLIQCRLWELLPTATTSPMGQAL